MCFGLFSRIYHRMTDPYRSLRSTAVRPAIRKAYASDSTFFSIIREVLNEARPTSHRCIGGPKMVHAACWSHARRGFVDAIKVNKLDVASIGIVELMDKLFAIDAGAREEKMDHAARHALRQKEGPPLLEKIHAQILELSKNVLPKSAAGEACGYTIKLWKKLSCFLEHPELELSNNLAENSMRGIALGRKNWTHIGSRQAGPRVAAILSVLESCRRLKIPVREYLNEILPGLANRSIQQLDDLTPAAWIARHTPDSL